MEIEEKLRSSLWNLWYSHIKKTNFKHKNFWKGVCNRIREEHAKEPKKRRDKLAFAEKAYQVESYLAAYPKYLSTSVDARDRQLLEEYISAQGRPMEILGSLGGGAFGTAYLVLEKERLRFSCLKLIDRTQLMERISGLDMDIDKRLKWARDMREIFHDEIVAVYDYFENLSMYLFHLEYFPSIDLAHAWKQVLAWDLRQKMALLEKILQGLKCLHLFGWAHRDLHAGNILVDILGKKEIKIIDFDLSKKGSESCGDSIWGAGVQAPERGGEIFGTALDMWAFGDLGYRLLTGVEHPAGPVAHDIARLPSEMGEEMAKLWGRLLARNPRERATAKEAHHVFRGWFQRYVHVESSVWHQRLNSAMFYLGEGGSGRIAVSAESGTAKIYFKDGRLLDARYGKMRGREVLEELCDEAKMLYGVDMEMKDDDIPDVRPHGVYWFSIAVKHLQDFTEQGDAHKTMLLGLFQRKGSRRRSQEEVLDLYKKNLNQKSIPLQFQALFAQNGIALSPRATIEASHPEKEWTIADGSAGYTVLLKEGMVFEIYLRDFHLQHFFLSQASENDIYRAYREHIQDLVCRCVGLEIGSPVSCKSPNCAHPKETSWSFENLLYGSGVFLYARDRYHLEPWCLRGILDEGEKRTPPGPRLSTAYRDYQLVYLDSTPCAHFYLGFKEQKAKVFMLYLKPPGIAKKSWDQVLKRVSRGYEILNDYPCRHFTQFVHMHPVKMQDEKYIVLAVDYFPGICLRQAMNAPDVPMTMEMAVMILFDLARALHALHREGIVHRNVNPSSVLLGVDGRVKLGDFSLCKYEPGVPGEEDHLQVTVNLTKPDMGGVLQYSSPEHLKDMADVTPKSDVWSWGILAYRLLTGKPAFRRGSASESLQAICREEVEIDGPEWDPVPSNVRELVASALEKNPVDRVSSLDILLEIRKLLVIPESAE